MKRLALAAALTWDGARVPLRALPAKARAFLTAGKTTLPSAKKIAEIFAHDAVEEIRICWVPQLRGGQTLSELFVAPNQKRIPYRTMRSQRFGDILGVIYRR